MDQWKVKAGEQGVVRVFELHLEGTVAAEWAKDPGAIAQAMGVGAIDRNFAEVFSVSTLGELGLRGYLAEGYGLDRDDLEKDATVLDALNDNVLFVMSRAFGGKDAVLEIQPPLRPVAIFREPKTVPDFQPLRSEAADGRIPQPSAAPSAQTSRRAPAGIIILMAILVGAMIVAVFGLGGG